MQVSHVQVEQHKWAEEGAELKGRLTAHEAQLDLMQVTHLRYWQPPWSSLVCTQRTNPCSVAFKSQYNGWRMVTNPVIFLCSLVHLA